MILDDYIRLLKQKRNIEDRLAGMEEAAIKMAENLDAIQNQKIKALNKEHTYRLAQIADEIAKLVHNACVEARLKKRQIDRIVGAAKRWKRE